ncbi:MAG: 3-hydroxyacyl-ACP dehydratase FabZ family protein [Phycisphaerae bacterium]|jgi:3-hydroxyacyl-[acyl-carrier-protein] dehydratase|nr:3-hydroxyacyl-ACP dehydratase FabZ family protein [Phycisphaerae bacterium]
MKFLLVDRIESIQPGQRIVTTKALTLAEEYLADHFPAFPVMPGVLMLEALVQSAAWLVRIEQNFAKSVVVLASARNVRYANFVQPGRKLRCELDAVSIGDDSAKFKGTGWIDENQAVSARLELKCLNLSDRGGYLADADESIISDLKKQFELVGGPAAMAAANG